MAITLDSMVLNPTLSQQPRVTSSVKADQDIGAFDLASQRIGQQVSATNVQLSASGQIKSSYADIQSAAKSLSAPGKSSTAEDTTKSVQAFAEAFNKAAQTVDAALKGNGKAAGALAGDVRANLAGYDLKKILTSGDNAADLQKIGININKDGALTVDAKALQSALQANPNSVQETLARVGSQAGQIVGKELSGSSASGNTINSPSSRSRNLAGKAAGEQKLAANSPVPQQTANTSNAKADNIASYMKMLSL